jgi:hypothetical protein
MTYLDKRFALPSVSHWPPAARAQIVQVALNVQTMRLQMRPRKVAAEPRRPSQQATLGGN